MEWTKEKKINFDHCIVGEPTSNKIVGDKLKIGRRGSINFFITVKGIQGHTANANRAENPAHHLIFLLHRIISNTLDEGNKYFIPSSIQIPTFDVGNSAANVIPELAKATINIRFNNNHTGINSAVNHMYKKYKESQKNKRFKSDVDFKKGY